jgi:hypothetical protein
MRDIPGQYAAQHDYFLVSEPSWRAMITFITSLVPV